MHSEFTVAQAFHLFLALSNPSALPVRDIFYRYISDIPPRWCCAPGLGALAPNESIQTTTRTHTHTTSLKNTSKKHTNNRHFGGPPRSANHSCRHRAHCLLRTLFEFTKTWVHTLQPPNLVGIGFTPSPLSRTVVP